MPVTYAMNKLDLRQMEMKQEIFKADLVYGESQYM